MEKKKPDIVYSEPVREIMGNPPASILINGNLDTMFLDMLINPDGHFELDSCLRIFYG